MEHFSPYLIEKPFKARTDHNALKWIKNFKQPKGQVARWIERLAVFDVEIEHQPGETMVMPMVFRQFRVFQEQTLQQIRVFLNQQLINYMIFSMIIMTQICSVTVGQETT